MDKNKNMVENIRKEHESVLEKFKMFDACEHVNVNHEKIPVVAQWVSILTMAVFTMSVIDYQTNGYTKIFQKYLELT